MDLKLDGEKNDNFKRELATFFQQYSNVCFKENGVLVYQNRDDLNVFGEREPAIITQLNKLLSSFTSFTGGNKGNLKIYRVKRKDSISFPTNDRALSRILLLVGDDAFAKTPLPTTGRSTGRAPVVTKLLEGGSTLMLKPDQDFTLSGAVKEKVFIKGKGKKEMVKPEKFEQYVVFYELIFNDDMLKNLRKEILKGGLDSVMKQNKDQIDRVLEEVGMGSMEEELEKLKGKEPDPEILNLEANEEDAEFL